MVPNWLYPVQLMSPWESPYRSDRKEFYSITRGEFSRKFRRGVFLAHLVPLAIGRMC